MYKSIGETEKDLLLINLKKILFDKLVTQNKNINRLKELASMVDYSDDTEIEIIKLSNDDITMIEGFFLAYDEIYYSKYGLNVTKDSELVENLSVIYNQAIIGVEGFTKRDYMFFMCFASEDDDIWSEGEECYLIDELEFFIEKKMNTKVEYFNSSEIQSLLREKDKETLNYFRTMANIDISIDFLNSYSDVDDDDYWLLGINYIAIPIQQCSNIEELEVKVNELLIYKGSLYEGGYQEAYVNDNNKYVVITYDSVANFCRTRKFWDKLGEINKLINRS